MRLSDEQIELITQLVEGSNIKSKELKDDLIDHFCCAVEMYVKKGLPFENALTRAQKDVSPNGLNEIQRETVYLLNAKKITTMRRIMYSSGLIFSMLLSLGLLFNLMRWPYTFILLMTGTLGLGFIFLPIFVFHQLRSKANNIWSEKLRNILGLSAGLLFTLSVVFKTLHLMGANVLLVLSFLVFTFGFLPFLFFKMYKKSA